MLTEVQKQWVAALRSGEYKQGKGFLRDANDLYCCLGVACDLAVKAGVIPEPTRENERDCYSYGYLCVGHLPEKVCDWLDVVSKRGAFANDQVLTYINDRGASFYEIADLIESEPEGLFVKGGAECCTV